MTRLLGALLLTASLAGGGCGRPSFGEVEGTVTLDGKPIGGIVVYFVPDSQEGADGPTSWGSTDVTGRYALACMSWKQQGALVGKHRVVCNEPELLLGGKKPRVPEHYRSPATTPLRVEVREEKQTIDLQLVAAP